jgi:hypothetical protein
MIKFKLILPLMKVLEELEGLKSKREQEQKEVVDLGVQLKQTESRAVSVVLEGM